MLIEGKVEAIGATAKGTSNSGKEWSKTSVLINTEKGEYPDRLAVDFFNKPDDIAKIKVGDLVKIEYNTKVTEKDGKFYNNINAWKLEVKKVEF
jgi:DNA helicase TIP49 (TBP-interacting protein)